MKKGTQRKIEGGAALIGEFAKSRLAPELGFFTVVFSGRTGQPGAEVSIVSNVDLPRLAPLLREVAMNIEEENTAS
jgi:hypothetical protein